MSESKYPRTDAAILEAYDCYQRLYLNTKNKPVHHTRMAELETELLAAQQTISQLRLDIASIREQHQREWNEFDRNENDADALKQTIAQQAGQIQELRKALGYIHQIVSKKDLAGEDLEIGTTAFKSVKRWASEALSTPAPAVVPCAWRQDDDGNWNTACGEIFCYNDGGPKENKTNFCQYCGKPVQAITYAPAQGEKGGEG